MCLVKYSVAFKQRLLNFDRAAGIGRDGPPVLPVTGVCVCVCGRIDSCSINSRSVCVFPCVYQLHWLPWRNPHSRLYITASLYTDRSGVGEDPAGTSNRTDDGSNCIVLWRRRRQACSCTVGYHIGSCGVSSRQPPHFHRRRVHASPTRLCRCHLDGRWSAQFVRRLIGCYAT